MRNRITIGFIRDELEKEKCKLLSDKYISSSTKFDYICANGHNHSISWNSWQRGCRCFYCNGKHKLTIDFISNEFKKEGYVLLTKNYINNKQKLEYICPNGHKSSIRWNDWSSGFRCYKCSMRIPSIEDISKEFEVEEYKLISTEYINSATKLVCVCPHGHEYMVSLDHWRKGIRCHICYNEKRKISFDVIKTAFEKEGYKILSAEYINANTHIKYKCSYDHVHSISWNRWSIGRRCPTCAIINRSGEKNYNWKGGISFEPYCANWDVDLKEYIKERDNYICQNPDCWETSKRLSIHHIDYNKKNCSSDNLITICNSCNSRANYDRDHHKNLYQTIIKDKYRRN